MSISGGKQVIQMAHAQISVNSIKCLVSKARSLLLKKKNKKKTKSAHLIFFCRCVCVCVKVKEKETKKQKKKNKMNEIINHLFDYSCENYYRINELPFFFSFFFTFDRRISKVII
jgi:hypothetical protein